MKNFKRTLALVLAVIMVAGMFAGVSAAKAKWYANAVRYIETVGIATIGSTADDKITRDEFVLWVAKLESGTLNDAYWSSAMETPFTDITEENNQTAIWYSARRGLIEGNGDGTFSPDKNLTFAEAAAVIVRLMRYTSKVEGDAEDWQWANMEVANEYCDAFNNTFLDNVGGSVYDYDYELTKGEVAYLLATVMNAPVIDGQIIPGAYRDTYKSLTIDGNNLGERFYSRWKGDYGAGIAGYYVSAIEFDFENGTIDSDNVVITSVSDGTIKTISKKDFTKLVRVSLGLSATKADDEDEINVRDTVKLGTLLDVTLNKSGTPTAIVVHSGSKVVDTHVVMDSMLGVEYGGLGIAGWTADSIVSGASNSNVYREAIINGNWNSELLFKWSSSKLVFEGTNYAFSQTQIAGKDTDVTTDDEYVVTGDLTVFKNVNNVLVQITNTKDDTTTTDKDERYTLTTAELKAMIPDVATGEVTLIFNDYDLDGKYDSVIINENAKIFDLVFVDNKTVNNKYYSAGYSISNTASGKLQLVVLAEGRFGAKTAFDSDADGRINEDMTMAEINNRIAAVFAENNATLGTVLGRGLDKWYDVIREYITWNATKGEYELKSDAKIAEEDEWAFMKDYGAEMNAYQVFDLATISSGVIEESTLRTFGDKTSYFVVKVKTAAGTYETVYIPATTAGATAPTFKYTINGIEKSYTPTDWDVNEKLEFVNDIPGLTGIKNDAMNSSDELEKYADNATKLVGQYISYIVGSGNKAIYCVAGAPAADEGYLLDIEETDITNMYNATIATVKDGAISDVKVYSVNATASVMMSSNYSKISALFNKGVISNGTMIDTSANVSNSPLTKDIKDEDGENHDFDYALTGTELADLHYVTVKSNGTFSYLDLATPAAQVTMSDTWGDYLNAENPEVLLNSSNKPEISTVVVKSSTDSTEVAQSPAGYVAIPANQNGETYYRVNTTYKGEYYLNPRYYFDDTCDEWNLLVDVKTVSVTYTFKVDQMQVTTANVKNLPNATLTSYLWNNTTGITEWVTWDHANKVVTGIYTAGSIKDNDSTTVPALVEVVDGKLFVKYDYRGVDFTAPITTDKLTTKDGVNCYTVANAKATNYVDAMNAALVEAAGSTVITDKNVKAGTTAESISFSISKAKEFVDATSSISNVAFTAMEKTESGYIPGSYWFTINEVDTLYFNGDTANTYEAKAPVTEAQYNDLVEAEAKVATKALKFRTTVNTEIVLLTPTETGYVVKVMTPAEAAAKDLIVTHYSFVLPEQLEYTTDGEIVSAVKSGSYNNYNNKLDAIVLVGQEALVATTPVEDDGKDVSEGEYLVYVPADTETILVAPEGSKTVKVASTKSVYAVPSGKEIGSIYYEYDVYTGAEQPTIKTNIATGWYIVAEDGEILGTFGMTKTHTNGYNGAYVNEATVEVVNNSVVATVYVKDKDGKTTTKLATYNLETEATLLYRDVDGTLKVVADKDAQFASSSIYDLTVKSALDAVDAAEAAYKLAVANGYSSAKQTEKLAARDAAIAAYNEALAANIDKFFNGDIWESFKDTVKKEQDIQGAGKYTIDIYTVDENVFVILNDWVAADDAKNEHVVATVSSNLK